MRKRVALVIILTLLLGSLLPASRRAEAIDRDVRTVIVAGEYGLLGGTLLGLASLPFSQDLRTVFIGTSVGLYLGIAIGIVYAIDRDEPENPHRPNAIRQWQGPELRKLAQARQPSLFESGAQPAIARIELPVMRF